MSQFALRRVAVAILAFALASATTPRCLASDALDDSNASILVISLESEAGTYVHEFGHQLGLPDLYWAPDRINVDGSFISIMAVGTHEEVCMLSICREREYDGDRGKKNWIPGRTETVEQDGVFTLAARTSQQGTICLKVPIPGTQDPDDYYMVECFDRYGLDDKLTVLRDAQESSGEADDPRYPSAGVFIYRVDSDNVDEVRELELQGPRKVWRKIIPPLISRFIPGYGHVFFEGDEFNAGDGVIISVNTISDKGTHCQAQIEVRFEYRDDPLLELERRIQSLKNRLLEELSEMIDE